MRFFNVGSKRGFTLIEMMIVLLIVGIIAAIAYPQYTQYLIKAGRSEGASALLQLMERQENFYRDELRYTTDLTELGYSSSNIDSENARYQLTAGTCSNSPIRRCVLLTAAPQNEQAADTTGNLSLDSRGVKSDNWPG